MSSSDPSDNLAFSSSCIALWARHRPCGHRTAVRFVLLFLSMQRRVENPAIVKLWLDNLRRIFSNWNFPSSISDIRLIDFAIKSQADRLYQMLSRIQSIQMRCLRSSLDNRPCASAKVTFSWGRRAAVEIRRNAWMMELRSIQRWMCPYACSWFPLWLDGTWSEPDRQKKKRREEENDA